MRVSRQILGIVVVLLLVAIGFILFKSQVHQVSDNEIKIGAVLPLTGPNAQWGIPPQRGALLAVEEANADGGINGKKIVLLSEDSQCEPQKGVSAFRKIISDKDIKAVLGAVCSSVTLAIAPIAEKNKIILISPASTNPKISQAGDYIFRVIPSDALRGKVFAEYLYNKGYRKVAILYINNDGGRGNRDAFAERFKQLGGKIVLEESYEQDATDVRSQLTKIKHSDAEAVVVVSYLGDTPIVMKQAKELGLSKPLYFQTEAVEDPNVLKAAGKAAEGVIYILPAPPEGKAYEEFKAKYREKYGKDPELFAAEAYDAVNLILQAIRSNNGLVDPDKIKEFLYSVKNYQGASGIITFDKNGDVLKPMAIKQIKNGKPTLLEIVEPWKD